MTLHLLERDRRWCATNCGGDRDGPGEGAKLRAAAAILPSYVCEICSDPKRDATTLCVVEAPADVMAIEQSGSFRGHYYVLMGHLSPIDGIGPEQLGLDTLCERD
jgi:recombination protein RecR